MAKHPTNEQLIEDIKKAGSTTDKQLTMRIYDKIGKYGSNTILKRFGGWSNAIENILGYRNSNPIDNIKFICPNCSKEVTRKERKDRPGHIRCCSHSCASAYQHIINGNIVTKEMLLDDIKYVYNILKDIPTCLQYNYHGKYSSGTVIDKLGKWNDVMLHIFGRNNARNIITMIDVRCAHCDKSYQKRSDQYKYSISKNKRHFCSRSCVGRYNNAHKTKGINVSKMEIAIQKELLNLYPDMKFIFNSNETIASELDIYIPSLRLAFELNGIFHYEPIFGQEKLDITKNNDKRKFQACFENNIELCIIDISANSYVKPHIVAKYLNIITDVIDYRIKTGYSIR